jgi:hypothetical protein
METTTIDNKQEIANWVTTLENRIVLDKINELMKAEKKAAFENDFVNAIPEDEFYNRIVTHIETLTWKK